MNRSFDTWNTRNKGLSGGRRMGRGISEGRNINFRQEEYSDVSRFKKPVVESMSCEQELLKLKEQAKALETQINKIDSRIKGLKKGKASSAKIAVVNPNKCTGCFICTPKCPTGAISINVNTAEIDQLKCIGCGVCVRECPQKAIYLSKE